MNWSALFSLKPKPIQQKFTGIFLQHAWIHLQMYVHSVFASFGGNINHTWILKNNSTQHLTDQSTAYKKSGRLIYIYCCNWYIVPRSVCPSPRSSVLYSHSPPPPAQTLQGLRKWSTLTTVKFEFENDFHLAPPKSQLPRSSEINFLMAHQASWFYWSVFMPRFSFKWSCFLQIRYLWF